MLCNTINPDSKVHGVNMGPTSGRQDPGGPHVGPMNLAVMEFNTQFHSIFLWLLTTLNTFLWIAHVSK